MSEKRVLAAMSGGVDSSAAAVLLQQQGYAVEGAMLRLHDAFDPSAESDARAAAARLGIPFHLLDRQADFQQCVMDRFIKEYEAGRTPNPCVDCNRCLKFGTLLDWALAQGFDYLATGHYARVRWDEDARRWQLLRCQDRGKDQSYVLYQLTQRQLRHLLLPTGEHCKPDIRRIAQSAGLTNAQRADSQDICFIPDGDYTAFLRRKGCALQEGNFVDESGRVLGRHKGLPCYTIGQGKGLGISVGRHVYVLEKRAADNTIVLGDDSALYRRELTARAVNWIAGEAPEGTVRCTAKTRYSQKDASALAEPLPAGRVRLVFDEPQRAITAGQAVVLYDGEAVLGGGTIE